MITRRQRIQLIIEDVARVHGVPVCDLLRRSHVPTHVAARHAAIAAVQAVFPDLSSPQLGRIFNRSHVAILYALGRLGPRNRTKRRRAA